MKTPSTRSVTGATAAEGPPCSLEVPRVKAIEPLSTPSTFVKRPGADVALAPKTGFD